MKFMQRAAAASSSAPTSPTTATTDDGRSSKRQKTAGRSSLGTPETPSYVVNQAATQAALEEEERKRQAIIEKRAEQLGDSHWVLDAAKLPGASQAGTPLRIVQVGFSQIDGGDGLGGEDQKQEEVPKAHVPTFLSYGPKKVQAAKRNKSESNSDSDSDSDSHSSDSSDSSSEESQDVGGSQSKPGRASYGSQKRDEIRARKKVELEKAKQLAAKRRTKSVQLNKLTSISGAGSFSQRGPSGSRR